MEEQDTGAAPDALEHEFTAAPPPLSKTDALVDAWFAELHANIPALRETENFNRMRAQIAELKARLK
jgi:hypothetical protein